MLLIRFDDDDDCCEDVEVAPVLVVVDVDIVLDCKIAHAPVSETT